MDIFNYRVFVTVAKYSSFQKAAELHNITSPAVSHIIKQLEKQFGFALLNRNNRSVSLTVEGEALIGRISEIVRKEDELFELSDELNGLDKGHVRLGIFNSMCFYIPSVIRGFNAKYPHISFEIYQGSYEDIIYWLKSGIVDIGFLSRTVNPGFSFCKIFSDPLMCILPKDTVAESDETIKLENLDRAAFVMQRESCDADARLIMDKLNLEVRTICHVVDDKTTVEMVKNGFGFAIMPLLTMKGMEDEVKMLKIIPECEREIGVSVLNDSQLSPAVKKAFEYIKSFKY